MRTFVYLFMFLVLSIQMAFAVEVAGTVEVDVSAAGKALAGAQVKLVPASGQARVATTGADGMARFPDVVMGDVRVEVTRDGYTPQAAELRVGAGGATRYRADLVAVAPAPASQSAPPAVPADAVIEVRASRILVNPRNPVGVTTNRLDFASDRNQTSVLQTNGTQGVVSTVPGVQTNSVGQFHVRGEHKAVGLSVDGINIPILAEDSTSQYFDPRLLQSMEVQTGFFDSSAGGQLGALLNVKTPEGTKDTQVEITPTLGTFDTQSLLLRASGASDDLRTSYYFGALTSSTDNKLNPVEPDAQTLNNRGEDDNFLLRLSHRDGRDSYGATFSYYDGKYGVPQTGENFAAGVRQDQDIKNFLGVTSFRRDMDPDTNVLFGLAFLRSAQRISNNGVFTPFTAFDPARSEELAEEGFPLDPENPGSPYLPTVKRVNEQVQPTFEVAHRTATDHQLKGGVSLTYIRTREIANIVDAGGGGQLPGAIEVPDPVDPDADPIVVPATVFDVNLARRGMISALYFSDTFPVGDRLVLNAGARAEEFKNFSTVTASQVSPRLNAAYDLGKNQVLRASYNRTFNAPPLEVDTTGGTFTLPQRTHQTELAYEFQPFDNAVGRVAGVYKEFKDQVDVGLLIPNSNVPLFGPVNFGSAVYRGLELSLNTSNRFGWNGFLAATLFAVAKPLTQGRFTDELPRFNDHDQRNQVNTGANYTFDSGITLGGDVLWASGFPQEAIGLYNQAGVTPFGLSGDRFDRAIANLSARYAPRDERGRVRNDGLSGTLQVQNVFDEREVVNFLSEFSGTRFVQGRRTLGSISYKF